MTYEEAVQYILEIPKFSKKTSLDNIKVLLDYLQRPERGIKIIHVAGTNGKGSVCAFIDSILRFAGKKTGLFTSPHLVSINERFRAEGKIIGDKEFLDIFYPVYSAVGKMVKDGFSHPSFFEFLFAMSLVFFQRKEVEYAILETGLGGRFDATNVIEHPMLTVITPISLDHTEILGDTIEKIAFEKAGILKKGCPVVFYGENPGVEKVMLNTCQSLGISFYNIKNEQINSLKIKKKHIDFSINTGYYEYNNIEIPFIAEYQAVNAALAVASAKVLEREAGISETDIRNGLRTMSWPGRMEMAMPGVVLDGAHNAAGIDELSRTLKRFEKKEKLYLLFTAVKEKDYVHMIEKICRGVEFEKILVTEVEGNRKLPAARIGAVFRKYTDRPVEEYGSIRDAFCRGLELRKKEGILFCAGSLYLIGEIERIIKEEMQ